MARCSLKRVVLLVVAAAALLWLGLLTSTFLMSRQKSILRFQIEQELSKYVWRHTRELV